ncbi:MAG: peptidylprolyl isomerase, partial [Muribaculaceae bacterium]|nr:peptidylprolyl isomerase [Muribaculaceae bacterium]
MKKIFVPLLLAAMSAMPSMGKAKADKILLTVGGEPVTVSEFMYLYEKTNAQQAAPQSVNDYLNMFVDYRLKVADARVAGIDTTQTFLREFNGYRDELAAPYLRDASVDEQLINESYARMQENVNIDHLLLPLSMNKATVDSIRNLLVNGADFTAIVHKYSIDPGAQQMHGKMGWISANIYPYEFEKAAFATAAGNISPVATTRFGYHILKVNARRPNPGNLKLRHIMRLPRQGQSAEMLAEETAKMDSAYAHLMRGDEFANVAARYSEDKRTVTNRGVIDNVAPGRMFPQYEEIAWNLKDGETSRPFLTPYGYFIVQRISTYPVEPMEKARQSILDVIKADDQRSSLASDARLAQLRQEYNASVDDNVLAQLKQEIADHGTYDDSIATAMAADSRVLITVNGKPTTVAEFFAENTIHGPVEASTAIARIDSDTQSMLNELTAQCEKAQLATKYPDYRNLIKEYHDGMMLFEISSRKVWDKSRSDADGLASYFESHRSEYTWDKPRYKGYVVYTTDDSTATEIKSYMAANALPN